MPAQFPIPLNAIRAIESVARSGSLAPAAAELNVTPGAISQHINRAEERLGVALFERTPKGLVPTEALQAALPRLSAGFAALADGMAALRPVEGNTLTLTCGAMFASLWLVPRLGRFAAACPDIELRLVATPNLIDFNRSDIDCGVRFGPGIWPGAIATLIGTKRYAPICAPALVPQFREPAELARAVVRDESTMLNWERWFAAAGIVPAPNLHGPAFSDPLLAYEAGVAGQGAVLVMEMLFGDALASGRMVRPFPFTAETEFGYWFVQGDTRRLSRPARRFRDWLDAEMAATLPT